LGYQPEVNSINTTIPIELTACPQLIYAQVFNLKQTPIKILYAA
jgi:hypothetical protein